MAEAAKQRGAALSIGLLANAAEVYPEFVRRGIVPDIVTDQTSAHEELNGYVPAGAPFEEAIKLRHSDPTRYVKMSFASIVKHVQAMIDLHKMGAVVFEYGNEIRGQAEKGGLENAHQFPGFIDGYIRPLFCQGRGPFRWVALSGDPNDIHVTDEEIVKHFPRLGRWIAMAKRIPFQGLPARTCWLGHGERTKAGLLFNELVRQRKVKAPIVIGRDHLDCGSVAGPDKQTANMPDGSDTIADWPILKGLLNVATGATWVAVHAPYPSIVSSGMQIVVDGTEKAAERIRRSLTADTGLGVTSYADAGYQLARETLKNEPFYFTVD